MAMVGQTKTLPKDWDRIDCARQHMQPWATVKIGAYRFSVKPGGKLSLYVRGAHSLCDDLCYKWRIIRGGGQLSDLYGKRVVYEAPAEQPECKDNPLIQLEYCGELMDTQYIAVSSFISDETAYYSAGPFRDGYFPHEGRCHPYKIQPHGFWNGELYYRVGKPGVHYESPFWCGDETIIKSCVTMRRHACDGRVLWKGAIGLRQGCAGLLWGLWKVIKGDWHDSGGWGFMHGAFGVLRGWSYADAKQDLLDGFVMNLPAKDYKTLKELFPEDWYPGDPLPEGVTLEGPGEFPEMWYSGDAPPENLELKEDATFPSGWTAGDPVPEGVNIEKDAWFPDDWKPTDPLPKGMSIDEDFEWPEKWTPGDKLPEGASFPEGEYFEKGWHAGHGMPDNVTIAEGASFPPGWYSGDPLPEGVTLDPGKEIPFDWQPGDELPEGLHLPPIWPEGRPKWWVEKWKGGLLTERGVLDVRSPALLEEDCCVPEEEWEPT